MVKNYIVPSFKDLKPRRIQKVNKKIKESRYYSGSHKVEKKPDEERFTIAYKKFTSNEKLNSRDFKVLASYLEKVDDDNNLDKYLRDLKRRLDSFLGVRGFVRPLLSYIYNYEDMEKRIEVYKILKIVSERLENKERFKELSKRVNKNTLRDYLSFIKQEFKNKRHLEFEEICYKYKLQMSDKFYIECLSEYILMNFRDEEVFYMFEKNIRGFEQKLQNKIYEKVMLIYIKNYNVDAYDDKWFTLIKEQLGDPYSRTNYKWNGIDKECKEIFRRWNNNNYIREFFDKVAGDKRRLKFWKKYIDCIYRIQFYEDKNKALVMEFRNHLFIEFAQEGNAMYYYDKRVLDIDEIEKKASAWPYRVNMRLLKDKDKCIEHPAHAGLWEDKFDEKIKRLGYKYDKRR